MSMSSVVNYTLAAWNTTKRNQDNDLADQDNIETDESMRHLSTLNQALISFLYVFGVGANICSLILLKRGETTRNGKQTLMVRCLIWNDLLALVGSFFLMYIQLYLLPGEPVIPRWLCILRVLLRTFGLSSGSVTTVMSVERWLALTRPFFYQKHINHKMIKVAIGTLWSISLLLVCLPFTGFGLYYDTNAPARHYTCVRYRFAVKTVDIAYAYFMFTFGIGFCVVIVFCNLTVVIVLSKVGKTSKGRMGRTTISRINRELFFNHTTHEEISFAKLMLILCVFFIMCWTLLTIIVAHWDKERKHKLFYRIADICMALNFILDPVIYVLSRRPYRRELKSLLKPFCLDCYPQLEWINSNGSRTFQRNSGYPWNIGMSAIYCKACQDEMSERHCSKHDHINPIFRVKDQLRHGKIEVRPNQKPVGDESRTSYTESQRKFLESIVVQIRIHDGQNSSVHMWNNKKKQWSKFNRKKCSCCKKNCYRDFFSDDYKTLGRTSVHVTGVSPLNYHSLPESLCKEYLANSCPSSFSNDKKTSDIDLNADTTQ
ncbi:prostaglandin E2 receptor EP2 subtype-like [Tachypleus tridentatus]|uniref:prostaglandin E2 receptor EP2 subtype-like n=1 Tax=Tachypleus tridentatus TaxID=6853 RepID=UPI003FD26261